MEQSLIEAMHLPEDSDTVRRIHQLGWPWRTRRR